MARRSRSSREPARIYAAYGLAIRSEVPLPELRTLRSGADLVIKLEDGPADPVSKDTVEQSGDIVTVRRMGAGTFRIRAGREIAVRADPGAEPALLRLLLLGPALGVALHQRGRLVIHASAVDLGGFAVAFLADTGTGKSTLAASLHALGRPLITDDVAAVEFRHGKPFVPPGFPRIKVGPELARSLGHDPRGLARVPRDPDRLELCADRGFARAALPLRHLFVLDGGAVLETAPLPPRETVLELTHHSYCRSLLPDSGDRDHFLRCAALAERAQAHRLHVPRSLEAVRDAARLVLSGAFR